MRSLAGGCLSVHVHLRSHVLLSFFSLSGLKTGGSSSSGAPGSSTYHYTFHGDPHATFASFFGGSNPFDMFFGSNRGHGRSNGFSFHNDHDMEQDIDMDEDDPFAHFGRQFGFPGGMNNGLGEGRRRRGVPSERLGPGRKHQDPPVVHELKVSLEEIFHGCTKRMKITRRRLNPDGRSMRTEDKILNIIIKKGWKEGTKITFPKEGDETPENIPADIAFVLKDKGHAHFRRDGSNIIYNCKISLKEVRLPILSNLCLFCFANYFLYLCHISACRRVDITAEVVNLIPKGANQAETGCFMELRCFERISKNCTHL